MPARENQGVHAARQLPAEQVRWRREVAVGGDGDNDTDTDGDNEDDIENDTRFVESRFLVLVVR